MNDKVTMAVQPGDGRIPSHPTFGWARAELAALGMRAGDMTQAQVNAELRRRGYDVNDGPMPSSGPTVTR